MTISIVIPAHNEEELLPLCLEHCASARTAEVCEILVINNASTDATADIARSVPGVRVVDEPQKGLTKARQRGLKEANGDILAYVDADTLISQEWLEAISKVFTESPEVVCLSGPYDYIDLSTWQRKVTKAYWYGLAYPTYLITRAIVVGGNFAARRSALEAMGGFDTSIAFYGEDTNIARRMRKIGKVRFDLRLSVPSSGRRLREEGFVRTGGRYAANFLSETFLKKPLTTAYNDIR